MLKCIFGLLLPLIAEQKKIREIELIIRSAKSDKRNNYGENYWRCQSERRSR